MKLGYLELSTQKYTSTNIQGWYELENQMKI